MLSGSGFAFMALTVMYVVGRQYGYQLSGFEMVDLTQSVWVIGLVDYARLLANGRQS